jgi:serine/threonine-protein kinase SRPK3
MYRSPLWPGMLRTIRSFGAGLLPSQPPIRRRCNGESRRGGFLRVLLGDLFDNQRYKVLRKLGYGQYSTVWLARDDRQVTDIKMAYMGDEVLILPDHRIMSLSKFSVAIVMEDLMTFLSSRFFSTSMRSRNGQPTADSITFYDSRIILSISHGEKHICIVFEVLGHHLGFQITQYKQGRLPVWFVKEITRQMLLALDFLHSECNVIHTGSSYEVIYTLIS